MRNTPWAQDRDVVKDSTGSVVAWIWDDIDAGNLIAAAPDLLAACKAVIEEYEEGKSFPEFDVRETVRAAIAKASGESPD